MKNTTKTRSFLEGFRLDGIPEDSIIVGLPGSRFLLEFLPKKDGRFQVSLIEPKKDKTKLIEESASRASCLKLVKMSLLPGKGPRTKKKDFISDVKNIIKPQ